MTPHRIGTLLVAAQFALMMGLGIAAAPAFIGMGASPGAWVLVLGSAGLGAWAVWANRPGNFNIRPTPREGGRLIGDGPYRWIRHPMYTAVLVCAMGCAWAAEVSWAWLAWVVLAAVLACKAVLEERWMAAVHPGYEAYCARTSRFVPGLF